LKKAPNAVDVNGQRDASERDDAKTDFAGVFGNPLNIRGIFLWHAAARSARWRVAAVGRNLRQNRVRAMSTREL
jgi:hypothetical protein